MVAYANFCFTSRWYSPYLPYSVLDEGIRLIVSWKCKMLQIINFSEVFLYDLRVQFFCTQKCKLVFSFYGTWGPVF